jgi:hypothetical protein
VKAALVLCGFVAAGCGDRAAKAHPIPGDRAPALTVEVLNASGVSGGARAGTRLLRQAGIDVVYYGNAPGEQGGLDSTRIVVRRGGVQVGEQIRAVLGVGRVSLELDSSRLLDASVLLGADFPGTRSLDFHP